MTAAFDSFVTVIGIHADLPFLHVPVDVILVGNHSCD